MKIAIVTDSNSGITPQAAKKLGVTIIPMPFLINGEEYFEEVNLTQQEFYQKLAAGADVSTSQPSIFGVVDTWKELLKTHDEVIHIPMSSGLSASCETAMGFAKEFGGKVRVIDNHRISITQKQSVRDAVKLASEGKTGKEIEEFLYATSMQASIYIMVTTLKYLKKGGRVTPAAAAIGSLLKIKPVLQIQGEKLDKFAQVISTSQGKKRMIDRIANDIETRFSDLAKSGHLQIAFAHTNCKEKCEEFMAEAQQVLGKYNVPFVDLDPLSLSVSCHIGDGSIAVACMYKY